LGDAAGRPAVRASLARLGRARAILVEALPGSMQRALRRAERKVRGGDALATPSDLEACYRLFLGRSPDEYGYRTYGPMVAGGRLTVNELSSLFLASREFRHRITDALGWQEGAPERVELANGDFVYLGSDDPVMEAAVKAHQGYEPHVVRRLSQVLGPGMTFVDVGASFGYHTLIAGRLVGPTGRVIACEPGPQNISVLLLNIEAHQLTNVTVHPVAASDQAGSLLYYGSGGNGHVSPFSGRASELAGGSLVPARPIDELLGDKERVHAIKIDVEGAEGLVLAGARCLLARCHPALLFEFSPPALQVTSACSGQELLEGLQALGYRFEVLDARGEQTRGRSSVAEVLLRFEASGWDHIDVLATCGD
jgi:FkbM family methyltransferase